ncbi:MAG: putative selenium-dependent hydroxylase accessory protein YqeC, partial [Chloroflexi bacterium]
VSPETPTLLKMVNSAWKQHHRVAVAGRVIGAGKIGGVQANQPFELLAKGGADIVIVEADGARHRMIKAPVEHEPVIPFRTNLAFLLMSAEAINQPLSTEIAHRPERIASVLGIGQGDILTPERVARLMTSEQGAMKNIPEQTTIYLLITHVSIMKQDAVQELISLVHHSHRLARVVCSVEPGNWFLL